MSKNKNFASDVKRHISNTFNNKVFYGKRYQIDEAVVTQYPFEQNDWQRSVQEIAEKVKSYDTCLVDCYLKFENNSFDLEKHEVMSPEIMQI